VYQMVDKEFMLVMVLGARPAWLPAQTRCLLLLNPSVRGHLLDVMQKADERLQAVHHDGQQDTQSWHVNVSACVSSLQTVPFIP